MNDFIIGAAWMAGSLSLGMLGAWLWVKFMPKTAHVQSDLVMAAVKELAIRTASLESKVNLVTAFRKPGAK